MSKKKKKINMQRRKKMAILTAKCDQPFIVSQTKVAAFKEKSCNTEIIKKINISSEKLQKNMTIETLKNEQY